MMQKILTAYDVVFHDENNDLCVDTFMATSEVDARIHFYNKYGSKLDIWDVHPVEL